ncbi:MAG: mechanosensitive ion channel [Myxococcota bacterium]
MGLVFAAFKAGSSWLRLPAALDRGVGALLFLLLVSALQALPGSQVLTFALERLGRTRLADTRYGHYYESMKNLWPLAQRSFEAVVWISAATLVIGTLGILTELESFGPMLIRIVGVVFVARAPAAELTRVLVDEWFDRIASGSADEIGKRRRTLGVLVQNVLRYAVFFVAALLVLRELGLDPAPFLAGAGIVGVSVGLGARDIINDILSGFVLMFEGHLNPGDYVRIGDTQGVIEPVDAHHRGCATPTARVHTRNGQISTIVNFSRS